MGLDSPLTHSTLSQTWWPVKAEVGLRKAKPAALAAVASVRFRRSAVALSRDISVGENQVKAWQSWPLNTCGQPPTSTPARTAAAVRVAARPGSGVRRTGACSERGGDAP